MAPYDPIVDDTNAGAKAITTALDAGRIICAGSLQRAAAASPAFDTAADTPASTAITRATPDEDAATLHAMHAPAAKHKAVFFNPTAHAVAEPAKVAVPFTTSALEQNAHRAQDATATATAAPSQAQSSNTNQAAALRLALNSQGMTAPAPAASTVHAAAMTWVAARNTMEHATAADTAIPAATASETASTPHEAALMPQPASAHGDPLVPSSPTTALTAYPTSLDSPLAVSPLQPQVQFNHTGNDTLGTAGTVGLMQPNPVGAPQPSLLAADSAFRVPIPIGAPGWHEAVGERVAWLVKQDIQQVSLHLNPRHLGPVDITLTMDRDTVSVAFTSPHSHVRETLEAALPALRDAFVQNGVTLERTTISSRSAEFTDNGSLGAQPGGGNHAHGQSENAPRRHEARGDPESRAADTAQPLLVRLRTATRAGVDTYA